MIIHFKVKPKGLDIPLCKNCFTLWTGLWSAKPSWSTCKKSLLHTQRFGQTSHPCTVLPFHRKYASLYFRITKLTFYHIRCFLLSKDTFTPNLAEFGPVNFYYLNSWLQICWFHKFEVSCFTPVNAAVRCCCFCDAWLACCCYCFFLA